MKFESALKVCLAAALLPAGLGAEGTETLGPYTAASGSGMVEGGVGLHDSTFGTIHVNVPAGAIVKQVLLYWEGESFADTMPAGDGQVTVQGSNVAGTLIGGPTVFFQAGGRNVVTTSYRADITSLNIVNPGANSIDIADMQFDHANSGAGVLVIYQLGEAASGIQVRDGNDDAFLNFEGNLKVTMPQTFAFAAASAVRTADLILFVGSVDRDRPNRIRITAGDNTTFLDNFLGNLDGPQWETVTVPVTIPAGATTVQVELISWDDPTDRLPASLEWVVAALSVPPATVPQPPSEISGCTRTQGYWKTHSSFGPAAKVDPAWDGRETKLFFDTGMTWYEVLSEPPRGNAYFILAHQYIAAYLNTQAGADATAVATELATAAQWLDQYDTSMESIQGSVREQFTSLAETLDRFNSGQIGPGACEE